MRKSLTTPGAWPPPRSRWSSPTVSSVSSSFADSSESSYQLLQMNLCLSGQAGCYSQRHLPGDPRRGHRADRRPGPGGGDAQRGVQRRRRRAGPAHRLRAELRRRSTTAAHRCPASTPGAGASSASPYSPRTTISDLTGPGVRRPGGPRGASLAVRHHRARRHRVHRAPQHRGSRPSSGTPTTPSAASSAACWRRHQDARHHALRRRREPPGSLCARHDVGHSGQRGHPVARRAAHLRQHVPWSESVGIGCGGDVHRPRLPARGCGHPPSG